MTKRERKPGAVGSFPFVFRRIVQYFKLNGPNAKEIVYPMQTEEQAAKLRFTWYNFIKALRADSREEEDAKAVTGIIVKKKGSTLVFAARDMEADFVGLEAVLDQLEGSEMFVPPPPSVTTQPAILSKGAGFEFGRPKTEKEIMDELFGTPKEADPGA